MGTGAPGAGEAGSLKASSLRPGAIIDGKYRLERLIGTGGMGAVWSARNLALDVAVALKFLVPAADRQGTACRLRNEAQLLARIKHPSLVGVHDVGVSERGADYIVMELLEGRDLDALLLERGALPPIETVRLMLPIIDGLRAAHSLGIIHRDIKPGNIFLAEVQSRSIPKLVDFGAALSAGNTLDGRLTHAGTVIGSPLYMSPEQARGALEIDERVDVWGVCAALYECLSGRPPFDAPTYEALLHSIATGDPAALGLSGAAAKLEAIVFKGLAKQPECRWRSADSLGRALASWLLEQGIDDDIVSQSIRSVWLGRASLPKVPPASRAKRRHEPSRRMHQRTWPTLMGALLLAGGALSWVAAAGSSGARDRPSISASRAFTSSAHEPMLASDVDSSVNLTPSDIEGAEASESEDPDARSMSRAHGQAAPSLHQVGSNAPEARSPEVRPIEPGSSVREARVETKDAIKNERRVRQPSSFDPFWGF